MLGLMFVTGCSSDPRVKTTVKPAANAGPAASPAVGPAGVPVAATNAVQPPSVIYVSNFYLDPANIQKQTILKRQGMLRGRLEQMRGDDPASQAQKLVNALSDGIVASLKKAGYDARRTSNQDGFRSEFIPSNVNFPPTGWLVGGWFTKVDEGNRALAAVVGFGVGAESAETEVVVSDLAKDPRAPFLYIGSQTGTASKMMPGGVVSKNPYAMAAKFVISRGATERDVKRQGAAIGDDIVEYIKNGPVPQK
jgi:hypothetical protein